MPGGNIDLGRDVDLINQALVAMKKLPPQAWHIGSDDPRTSIFPPGTRARASGQNLIYAIPGFGDVLQAAEANQAWNFLQWSFGTDFPAQERSWGFVVRSGEHWDELQPRQRAVTILHEFYHQHMQMRRWMLGWTLVYWPCTRLRSRLPGGTTTGPKWAARTRLVSSIVRWPRGRAVSRCAIDRNRPAQ